MLRRIIPHASSDDFSMAHDLNDTLMAIVSMD